MTPTPRALYVYPEDEDSWLAWVTDYATRVARPAWRRYHTRNAKGSDPGFPDLVLVRPPRLIFAELKTDSPRAKVTADQRAWLDDLAGVGIDPGWEDQARRRLSGPMVETYVWRPADRPDIERILR